MIYQCKNWSHISESPLSLIFQVNQFLNISSYLFFLTHILCLSQFSFPDWVSFSIWFITSSYRMVACIYKIHSIQCYLETHIKSNKSLLQIGIFSLDAFMVGNPQVQLLISLSYMLLSSHSLYPSALNLNLETCFLRIWNSYSDISYSSLWTTFHSRTWRSFLREN